MCTHANEHLLQLALCCGIKLHNILYTKTHKMHNQVVLQDTARGRQTYPHVRDEVWWITPFHPPPPLVSGPVELSLRKTKWGDEHDTARDL